MDGKASMSASSHSGSPIYRRSRIAITAKKLINAAGSSRGFLNKNKLMERVGRAFEHYKSSINSGRKTVERVFLRQ
jgi:hypothetical protein